MDNLDDLKLRIEQIISEIKDIIKLFEMQIADPKNHGSFRKAKEIEASIERLRRQGLSVPEELKHLKLNLLSTHERYEELLLLYNKFMNSIHGLKSEKLRNTSKKIKTPKPGLSRGRKSPDYEKPLGNKGYRNLEDYLIPVIKLMWDGHNHREAFRQIANKLDVRYNTVSSQCTRALGITTDEFISQVKSKTIVDLIEKKYPDQYNTIIANLK